jgi:FSR family fosmidomycin resistance protein-like MFS transporter
VRAEIDRRAMAALSAGHFATDFAGGALPALLPFLKDRFSLSYTALGVVILASQVSSSLVQPLFGLWSDRRGAMWLLPVGVALAGIGIGLAADAPSYWLVVAFVLIQGLGTAAFHPEGSKFAAYVSGRKRASGMSLFSIGGNMGYGLGPLVATACIASLGLRGAYLIAIPSIVVALALVALRPYLGGFVPDRHRDRSGEGEDRRGAMAVLLAVIACRNVAWFGLVTYVPLWEVSLGHSKAFGNHLLALMLLCGGIGTLALGPAADRFGRRAVTIASVVATGPLIFVFVAVGGIVGAVALALVGVCVVGTFGVTLVMSQEYLPQHPGLASGLTIGFALGLGGIAALVLGRVADATSLRTALWVCVVAPVAAVACAAFLPPTTGRARLEPELATP